MYTFIIQGKSCNVSLSRTKRMHICMSPKLHTRKITFIRCTKILVGKLKPPIIINSLRITHPFLGKMVNCSHMPIVLLISIMIASQHYIMQLHSNFTSLKAQTTIETKDEDIEIICWFPPDRIVSTFSNHCIVEVSPSCFPTLHPFYTQQYVSAVNSPSNLISMVSVSKGASLQTYRYVNQSSIGKITTVCGRQPRPSRHPQFFVTRFYKKFTNRHCQFSQ